MIESSEKSSLKKKPGLKPEINKNMERKQEMIKVIKKAPIPSTSQSTGIANINTNWEKYLEMRAGQPALDGHLFQHQYFVERTLGEHIFRPGRLVNVHHKLDGNKGEQMMKGRIEVTIKEQAIVEIIWTGKMMPNSENGLLLCSKEKIENEKSTNNNSAISYPYKNFFPLSELKLGIGGTEEESGKKFEDAKMISAEEWESIDKEYANFLANHQNWLSRPLHTFIEIGQFFELHDAKNANLVHLVCIEKCKLGMILAKFGTKNQHKEWIHICNERCHPFGWTQHQNSKFAASHHPVRHYKLQNAFNNIQFSSKSLFVPSWLFTFRPLQEHKLEVGMLLEMLDPLNRLTFVPAFVNEVCNQHYFKVQPIRNVSTLEAALHHQNPREEYLCHRCSPELLPLGWCFKNQIRLVFPEGMKGDSNSFSYAALRNRLKELMEKDIRENEHPVEIDGQQKIPMNSIISFKFAPDALFELPRMMAKKLDCIRYCEVQNALPFSALLNFHPAAILRSHRHFIWIHLESNNLPKICSIHSLELFRIGSAEEFPNSLIFEMPIKIPKELALERRRFEETYNSDNASSIFLPNPKAFMPKMWIDDDLWLPKIHLNIFCFPGPFLCKNKLASLPFHFGPGPLPHLVNEILKHIILCSIRPKENAEMLRIVNENATHSQLMLVKVKHKERRIMANVEVCSRAAQFPGWLSMLLIRLDACSNLFSLQKLDKCECVNSMAQLAYLKPLGHPQMINSCSSKCLLNKFFADVKQINREMTNKQRKQDEGNGQKRKVTRIVFECSGISTRLMKTRAGARQQISPKNDDGNGKRLEQNAQPSIPEEEWSQESQCSTATTQSSSQSRTSTMNSPLTASSNNNEQMEKEEEDDSRGIVTPPIFPRKRKSNKISSNNGGFINKYSKLEKFLGAKLPIIKPKSALLLEEANKKMGIRVVEGISLNALPNSQPTIGGGMDRRVGTVPPNNVHQHDHHIHQPPFQFVQPPNPNQHFLFPNSTNPPFEHSQQILQQQMFEMGTAAGGFGYPSTSSSPFFPHPPPKQQFFANSLQEYQQSTMATPYFVYQLAAQQQQFGVNRPMMMMFDGRASQTTKYPPILSNPANWNCEQLAEWIGQCGHMEMANRLMNEEVDGASFLLFNVDTFRHQMKMNLGPAVKMNDLVETLKTFVSNFPSHLQGISSTGGQN